MYIVIVCAFKHFVYTHNQKLLLNIHYVGVISKNIIKTPTLIQHSILHSRSSQTYIRHIQNHKLLTNLHGSHQVYFRDVQWK